MMTDSRLTRDMLERPELHRVAIEIDSQAMDVIVYSTIEDNALMYRHVEYDRAAPSLLKAVEDAVYDNDMLLADVDRVDVLVRTPHYAAVPAGCDTALTAERLWGRRSAELDVVEADTGVGATIVMAVDKELCGFVRRTFNNAPVRHPMWALARYWGSTGPKGNRMRMYVNIRSGRLDIVAFRRGELMALTGHTVSCAADTLYYVAATARAIGFDAAGDEMMVNASRDDRAEATALLRRYFHYVMPVIFPSAMFKAGKEALNAPFELIVMPICE